MKEKVNSQIPIILQIYEAMVAKGWKPAELSRRSGVSEATLNRVFRHGKDISRSRLDALCAAVGISKEAEAPSAVPIQATDQVTLGSLLLNLKQMQQQIEVQNERNTNFQRHLIERITRIQDALEECERKRDFLPLKRLSGTGS